MERKNFRHVLEFHNVNLPADHNAKSRPNAQEVYSPYPMGRPKVSFHSEPRILLQLVVSILLGLLGLLGLLSLLLGGSRGGLALLGALLLDGDLGLVLSVLLDELDQVLNGAGAGVGDGGILVACGVELDGGEALNLIGNVVGGSVNLGDDDLVLELRLLVQLTKLLVLGGQSLAVTAPGGVELNQDILLVIKDNLLVVLGNDNSDGTVVGLRDGLGLDAGLHLAGRELLNELGDVIVGDLLLLVKGELLVLDGLLDGERGELVGGEVEVAGVSTERLGVDGSEVDLAAVLLSDGLQGGAKFLTLLGGLGEDVGEGKASGHVAGVGLGADLTDQGSGGGLGEGLNGLSVELLSEGGLALIERLVEDNGRGLDALSLSNSGVVDATEEVGVAELLGDLGEGLVGGLVSGVDVGDENDLVGGLELLKGVLGEDGDGGQGLLHHVGGDGSSLTLARVGRDVVGAAEDLEGGVALNAVLLAEIRLLSAVDLDELDVLLLEGGGSLLVLGSEGLAVTAPGSEDYRRPRSVFIRPEAC